MSDLTESQKIALCAAAGIPYTADSSAVVTAVSQQREALRVRDNAFKRMVFTALGEMPAEWIDGAISNLISRRPKKGK